MINQTANTTTTATIITTSTTPVNSSTSSIETALTAFACGLVILLSLLGNTLVVFVISRYKRLQNATNFILLSLAIADLTVSIFVMLPSMIYDISKKWTFGDLFCKFYNSFDITCCTASILHLLLVAIDRYVAIFKPLSYRNMVRKCHVFAIVVIVWLLSACLSFIPIFSGLNVIDFANSNLTHINYYHSNTSANDDGECTIEANLPYAIISSSLSFYIPLILMIIVYTQIFFVARRQALAIAETDYHHYNYANGSHSNGSHRKSVDLVANNNPLVKSYSCNTIENNTETNKRLLKIKQKDAKRKRRTQDTKAIKTLGIIMGIFIICWLPFFVMYLYVAACPHCGVNKIVERLITWIGYVNSFINPIVYALTNRDFRKAYVATLNSIVNLLCPCILKLHKNKKKLLGNMIQNHLNNTNNYNSRNDLSQNKISSNNNNNNNMINNQNNKCQKCCCFICYHNKPSKNEHDMNINTKSSFNNNNNINNNKDKILANFNLNSLEDLNKNDEDENLELNKSLAAKTSATTTGPAPTTNYIESNNGIVHFNVLDNGNKKFYSLATFLNNKNHNKSVDVLKKEANHEEQFEIIPLNSNNNNNNIGNGNDTNKFKAISCIFMKNKIKKRPIYRL